MSDYDSTARRRAQNAESKAEDAINRIWKLRSELESLTQDFKAAVSKIETLEKEVARLKAELEPKKLDKSPSQSPLKNKD